MQNLKYVVLLEFQKYQQYLECFLHFDSKQSLEILLTLIN